MKNDYSIEELEDLTDAKRRTIHFYREQGLIRKPSTKGGGARYHPDTLYRLKLIPQFQKKSHLKLSGIREALEAMSIEDMRDCVENIDKSSSLSSFADFALADTAHTDEAISWHRYMLKSGIELHVRSDEESKDPEVIQNLRDVFNSVVSKRGMDRMKIPQIKQNGIKYPCWSVNEHIFFEAGNDRVLVDTGAPVSMGNSRSFLIGGEEVGLVDSYMGTTISEISRLLEYKFTVLLGADVLEKYDVTIDLEEGTILFSTGSPQPPDIVCPVEFFMGIPQIDVKAGNNQVRTFFDIGSRLSYIASKFTAEMVPSSKTKDFYPGMIGKFEVDMFPIPFTTGSVILSNSAGTLPKMLEVALLMGNASGITGSEFLDEYAVTLSKKRMNAEFRKLNK